MRPASGASQVPTGEFVTPSLVCVCCGATAAGEARSDGHYCEACLTEGWDIHGL